MKKVNCMVLYRKNNNCYTLYKIITKSKNNHCIDLYKYIKEYYYFNDLYKTVLDFLKHNNMYVYKWTDFNATWYDIDFINLDNLSVDRFSYK